MESEFEREKPHVSQATVGSVKRDWTDCWDHSGQNGHPPPGGGREAGLNYVGRGTEEFPITPATRLSAFEFPWTGIFEVFSCMTLLRLIAVQDFPLVHVLSSHLHFLPHSVSVCVSVSPVFVYVCLSYGLTRQLYVSRSLSLSIVFSLTLLIRSLCYFRYLSFSLIY